jgi:hypothetical protein
MPSVSFAGNCRVFRPFPPERQAAFHDAVLAEILQERLPERGHRRNKRGVKRKMSNFATRRRTDKPQPPVNIKMAIRIVTADSS